MAIVDAPVQIDPSDLQKLDTRRAKFWDRHAQILDERRAADAEREQIRVARLRANDAVREAERRLEEARTNAREQRVRLDLQEGALNKRITVLDHALKRELAGEGK